MKAVHAIVVADFLVDVARALRVLAQGTGTGRKLVVVGQQRSAFTVRAKIFCRVVTEAGDRAELAHAFALVAGTVCLRGVFHDGKLVFGGNGVDGIHVGRCAENVHRHNCPGACGHERFQPGRVERATHGIDVNEDGRGANIADGPCSGDEGEGRGDDLVTGGNVQATEGEVQRAGAAVQTDAAGNATIRRELLFECGCWRTLREAR